MFPPNKRNFNSFRLCLVHGKFKERCKEKIKIKIKNKNKKNKKNKEKQKNIIKNDKLFLFVILKSFYLF